MDILSGVGGAGLFSDGKHSFFPASTQLWALPDRAALAHAYYETLRAVRLSGPPFPESAAASTDDIAWMLKRYPALYVSLEDRMRCITELYEACGERPWLEARVIDASRVSGLVVLDVHVGHGNLQTVATRALIVATGRLSPRWTKPWLIKLGASFAFRRVEVGVRLETVATHLAALEGVDPKYSLIDRQQPGIRYLTFCMCRNGEIVEGNVCNLLAISGRADGPPTGRSSIGILARITDVSLARDIEAHTFAEHCGRLTMPLHHLTEHSLIPVFGPRGSAIVSRGVEHFVQAFAINHEGTRIHAPCIEGVGDYPLSDRHLQVADNVFVAGDVSGRFRGIIASMVSGRYVGARLSRR